MKHLLCIIISFAYGSTIHKVSGQTFLKPISNRPLSFKEIQLQFDNWSKTVDLKKEKGWKYFKRWEDETAKRTNPAGEPVEPSLYLSEIIRASSEKANAQTSRFSSAGWLPTGPNVLPTNLNGYSENGIGRINCIAFHPTDANTFFIGVAQGGVWKTTNGGQSWTPLTDNLPILRISDIAIDPVDPNTMYIAVGDFEYIGFGLKLNGRKRNTHYGLGVYKTTDGGQTWQPTGLSFTLTQFDQSLIRKVIINPNNTSQLVACGSGGMFSSNNGGNTWTTYNDSLYWDLVQDPIQPNVLYAASGFVKNLNEGSAGIWKSTDFGTSWIQLNTGIPPRNVVQRIRLGIAPSNPNKIYGVAVDTVSGFYGIYASNDAGTTWQFIPKVLNILDWYDGTGTRGQGTYDLGFLIDPTDANTLYVGGINLWKSTNGGNDFNPCSHWTNQFGPSIHADIHFIERQPLTGKFFVCADGGLYRTDNIISQSWNDAGNGIPWPTIWTALNDGFQVTSFYRISSSKTPDGRVIAGAQDNNLMYFDGNDWYSVFGGDGMDNYLRPDDNQYIIGSSQFGNFYLSTDGGFSGSNINTNPNNEPAEWTTPIVADYNNPGTMYIGNANVYQSTDYGNNWYQISNFPSSFILNEISALAVSPTNGNTVIAAKRVRYEYGINGSFFATTDGGSNWADLTAGLPDTLFFTSVDIHHANSTTYYVSVAGFTPGVKVFRSTNGGTTWQNISFNLPNLPVNCVKNIPGSDDLLAATDIGVYMFNNLTNTWSLYSTNLPNVIVSDIEFNQVANKVYISTFGRGIWESSLSALVSTPVIADKIKAELFPTLNNGKFTIRLDENFSGKNCSLEIVDIKGAVVYKSSLDTNRTQSVDTHLLPGRYFARLSAENQAPGVMSFVVY